MPILDYNVNLPILFDIHDVEKFNYIIRFTYVIVVILDVIFQLYYVITNGCSFLYVYNLLSCHTDFRFDHSMDYLFPLF